MRIELRSADRDLVIALPGGWTVPPLPLTRLPSRIDRIGGKDEHSNPDPRAVVNEHTKENRCGNRHSDGLLSRGVGRP
jgi:hypothetical protein